jgi:hypothetical protein
MTAASAKLEAQAAASKADVEVRWCARHTYIGDTGSEIDRSRAHCLMPVAGGCPDYPCGSVGASGGVGE